MRTTIFLTIALAVLFFSCEKNEDPAKPTIDFHGLGTEEPGLENSKTATIGGELHMDAEIVAENKIDKIEIEIHAEGEGHKKSVLFETDGHEWEFDTVYTKFYGLKNTTFHEHVEISETAEAGHYHFHFAVIDQEGYQTVFEAEIELLSP